MPSENLMPIDAYRHPMPSGNLMPIDAYEHPVPLVHLCPIFADTCVQIPVRPNDAPRKSSGRAKRRASWGLSQADKGARSPTMTHGGHRRESTIKVLTSLRSTMVGQTSGVVVHPGSEPHCLPSPTTLLTAAVAYAPGHQPA
jgi:hypothetical protein